MMKCILVGLLLLCTTLTHAMETLLVQSHYQKLPKTAEINLFLQQIQKKSPHAYYDVVGKSAGGLDFSVIRLSNDDAFLKHGTSHSSKLTVMLVGSMHGTEPSGSEALQQFVLDVLFGDKHAYLDTMNFIIVPNANPDGRDATTRGNALSGNINIDFSVMNFPESVALSNLLFQYDPNVILDMHESSSHKKQLSDIEGFYKDAEAQYECANNPNVALVLRSLCHRILLPGIIQKTHVLGLESQHYLGEILNIDQPVANGGVGISNFRNYAGLMGAMSFLVENKLDDRRGVYDTPFNIQSRVQKQGKSLKAFIDVIEANKEAILEASKLAKSRWKTFDGRVYINPKYTLNLRRPIKSVAMIEIKNSKKVWMDFPNANDIQSTVAPLMPHYLYVAPVTDELKRVLTVHHIQFSELPGLSTPDKLKLIIKNIQVIPPINPKFADKIHVHADFQLNSEEINQPVIAIDLYQPQGILAMLLLDYRSINSIYQAQQFRNSILKSNFWCYSPRLSSPH